MNYKQYYLKQIILKEPPKLYVQQGISYLLNVSPACWDVPTLVQLIDAGMSVARLNFSHGDHKGHAETVAKLREAFK